MRRVNCRNTRNRHNIQLNIFIFPKILEKLAKNDRPKKGPILHQNIAKKGTDNPNTEKHFAYKGFSKLLLEVSLLKQSFTI